jgi:hypothetical protein
MKGLIAFAAALTLAAPAAAAYPPWVLAIRDCADDGNLQGTYEHKDLAEALKNVPSDGDEYTDCRNAILRAMTGGSGKTDTAPAPTAVVTESGAVAASPEDAAQLEPVIHAAQAGEPVAIPIPVTAATTRAPRDSALDDIAASASPPYQPDTRLLAAVLAAGLVLLSGAAARARRRAAA